MTERREDLSTADLAAQQPTQTTPANRAPGTDVQRDSTDAEFRREDLAPEEREREPSMVEGRRPDPEPTTTAVGAPGAQAGTDTDNRTAASASTSGPLLGTEDAEGFRARWTDIQTSFVDAPRQAVEQADALVAELMQHLARTFADERGRLEGHWDRGDDVPTDNLRDAFQRYRSFFERLLAT